MLISTVFSLFAFTAAQACPGTAALGAVSVGSCIYCNETECVGLNFGGAVLCRCESGQKFNKDQECVDEGDCFPETTTDPTTTTAMTTTTMGHAGMEMKEETTTDVIFQTSVAAENWTQGRF